MQAGICMPAQQIIALQEVMQCAEDSDLDDILQESQGLVNRRITVKTGGSELALQHCIQALGKSLSFVLKPELLLL